VSPSLATSTFRHWATNPSPRGRSQCAGCVPSSRTSSDLSHGSGHRHTPVRVDERPLGRSQPGALARNGGAGPGLHQHRGPGAGTAIPRSLGRSHTWTCPRPVHSPSETS
jgi:hypothetical protein